MTHETRARILLLARRGGPAAVQAVAGCRWRRGVEAAVQFFETVKMFL